MRRGNRPPTVRPEGWQRLFELVSKADLWDAACYLAASAEGHCDDPKTVGFRRLYHELHVLSMQDIVGATVLEPKWLEGEANR